VRSMLTATRSEGLLNGKKWKGNTCGAINLQSSRAVEAMADMIE
jgi:hypothetical protein